MVVAVFVLAKQNFWSAMHLVDLAFVSAKAVCRCLYILTYFDLLMFKNSSLRFAHTILPSSFCANLLLRASDSWEIRVGASVLSSWASRSLSEVDCTTLASSMSRRDLFAISGGLADDTRDRLTGAL